MDGFVKVAAAIPAVRVADCTFNTRQIENQMVQAEGMGIEVICFPELSLTGYTCQDLFQQELLQEQARTALLKIVELSRNLNVAAIVGLPFAHEGLMLNCAAVVHGGKVLGLVPKTYIPNYNEFYEARWFSSANRVPQGTMVRFCGQTVPLGAHLLFELPHFTFGVEICEDFWAPVPPSTQLVLEGADIIFNLSASNEAVGKHAYMRNLVQSLSARCICGYVYAGSGYGESTQDVVFSGLGFVCENGNMLASAKRFSMKEQIVSAEIDVYAMRGDRSGNTTFGAAKEDCLRNLPPERRSLRIEIDNQTLVGAAPNFTLTRTIDPLPFVPDGPELDARCEDILCIQSEGLARRIEHTGAKTVVLGISGGLDSTLALLVCVNTFDSLGLDRKGIVGITMPGFGTTDRTYTNAIKLMKGLGVTIREISIKQACEVHFADLGLAPSKHDVTYENGQARERTQILMDAANQMQGFVVGTGDLSELALGWATYNGDHMSMYGVNASVPKTLVRHLVTYVAGHTADNFVRDILLDIVATPISPELIPADEEGNIAQKTEDIVGPYELHDFFLYYVLRKGFRPAKIFRLARRAFDGSDPRVEHYADETIAHWLTVFFRRFFAQQYKRSCLPDGPRVGSCSLSPRGDWRMPSDASSADWLAECDQLCPHEPETEEQGPEAAAE